MRKLLVLLVAACGSAPANNAQDASASHDGSAIDAAGSDGSGCVATPQGLGGRWRAEMNTTDDTGNSTSTVAGANLTYMPGRHGSAFELDGTTTAIEIDDGDHLWPAASFTIEAWVNTHATGDLVYKVQCSNTCNTSTGNAQWGLTLVAGGEPQFLFRADADNPGVFITDSTRDVRDGQWHYLVGVRDTVARTATLYVDGQAAGSAALTATSAGPLSNTDNEVDPITLGAMMLLDGSLADLYAGGLDEVAYYSAALTPQEIAGIYAAPRGECH
jgi:hypothetical protein